jgi:cytochrome c553
MLRVWVMLLLLAPAMVWALGDPQRGEQLAAVCSACHGQDGNSVVPEWPKIAGQHQDYAARQSILIRERRRDVPQMWPMVAGLSDQDIWDIAAYFERFEGAIGVADEDLVEHGRSLYMGGDHSAGIASCAGCHGPSGEGIPGAHFPKLRGQHADYTADRLRRYRAGENNGDDDPYSNIMLAVARKLSDADIAALASYIEGLHMARFDELANR